MREGRKKRESRQERGGGGNGKGGRREKEIWERVDVKLQDGKENGIIFKLNWYFLSAGLLRT